MNPAAIPVYRTVLSFRRNDLLSIAFFRIFRLRFTDARFMLSLNFPPRDRHEMIS